MKTTYNSEFIDELCIKDVNDPVLSYCKINLLIIINDAPLKSIKIINCDIKEIRIGNIKCDKIHIINSTIKHIILFCGSGVMYLTNCIINKLTLLRYMFYLLVVNKCKIKKVSNFYGRNYPDNNLHVYYVTIIDSTITRLTINSIFIKTIKLKNSKIFKSNHICSKIINKKDFYK